MVFLAAVVAVLFFTAAADDGSRLSDLAKREVVAANIVSDYFSKFLTIIMRVVVYYYGRLLADGVYGGVDSCM